MASLNKIQIDGNNYDIDAKTLNGKPASDYLLKSEVYPVGSIYISLNSTNPSSIFGGTWEQIQGRFLLGVSSSHPVNQTGGTENHSHGLSKAYAQIGFSWDGSNYLVEKNPAYIEAYSGVKMTNLPGYAEATGLQLGTPLYGNTDNSSNMPPYLAVYMWKRTA